MNKKIQLTPAILEGQAKELENIESDLNSLFSGVSSELKSLNKNWSPNLSNNFSGKITSAQKTFSNLCTDLRNGAVAARTSATTFASVDSQLAKVYSGTESNSKSSLEELKDSFIYNIQQFPEGIKTTAENLAWLEKWYGTWPNWITKMLDILLPGSLKDSIQFTSHLYQGTITTEELWDYLKHMLSVKPEFAIIFAALDFAANEGAEISYKMEQRINQQIAEGDIAGAAVELINCFAKLPVALTHVAGDTLKIFFESFLKEYVPGGEHVNSAFEYITAFFGENDGDGYSLGDLVKVPLEKTSEISDSATDFITDAVQNIKDTIQDGEKKIIETGINYVKSWFD